MELYVDLPKGRFFSTQMEIKLYNLSDSHQRLRGAVKTSSAETLLEGDGFIERTRKGGE